jgi:beta-phosphoglucomutase-like phosphatase (HAD superfamily)
VAIVSNNNADAVAAYLARNELAGCVTHIEGRDPDDASHMKPSPWTLSRALDALHVDASDGLLIGDAPTDVQAARSVGVRSIGYANRPAKIARLRDAGADAIVTDMLALAAAMSAARSIR